VALDLAAHEHLMFICPRYEGVDARVRSMVDLELSIGDYVLSGGELPAMVVIDAVVRLLPGAIDDQSPVEESFSNGLLEYPQYTRPAEFEGDRVPDVLLSGNHGAVDEWRREQAMARTRASRPDLLNED
jgi:tRNA (guanine37-N1)-methyltransferase